MSETGDGSTIQEIAERYYRAMVAGDEVDLRELFDPRAIIVGNYEGAFLWLDLQAFIDETKVLIGQHGKEECRVESLRIDGDIGTVAVRGPLCGFVVCRPPVRGPGWR